MSYFLWKRYLREQSQEAERTTTRNKVGALIKGLGTYAWIDLRLSVFENKHKIKPKMLFRFKS